MSKAEFRKATRQERHLLNFHFQLLRKFYGRSSEQRRYLAKRKAKRQAFNDRLDAHVENISEATSRDWEEAAQEKDPVLFSDEETDYNYYTTEEEDKESSGSGSAEDTSDEQHWKEDLYQKMRGIITLMLPLTFSIGVGAYLANLQTKKPPQAWSLFGSSDKKKSAGGSKDEPVVLTKNELKGRCKALQYPANFPCQDRLSCHQLNTSGFKGYYAAVFDGNSGWQLAENCSQKLHTFLEANLKNAKTDE